MGAALMVLAKASLRQEACRQITARFAPDLFRKYVIQHIQFNSLFAQSVNSVA
jgi:hypothetical protein